MGKESYLEKHAIRGPLIDDDPQESLEIFIVIPAYNETYVIETLESLASCDPPRGAVEVMVVINHRENESPEIVAQNELTHRQVLHWAGEKC